MINSLLKLFSKPGRRQRHNQALPFKRVRRALHAESLEARNLMAHLAVLDFDGATFSVADMNTAHWPNPANTTQTSFQSLFTSANPVLDVNGDGAVNNIDAQLAINRIVEKVRQDYSPFELDIVVGNLADRPGMLTDAQVGDVAITISGGTNNIDTQGANGLSPWTDLGNEHDEIGFVFGKACMTNMTTAEMVVNSVARSISHEMGHCFGLGHITATPTGMADAHSHHLMGVVVSSTDPAKRDYGHDFNFQDIWYQTDALTSSHSNSQNALFNNATQNAFRYLSNPSVLGASDRPWIAMLKPGELTISGDGAANTINVNQFFTTVWPGMSVEHWDVSASATHYVNVGGRVGFQTTIATAYVDPRNPSITSLNPYDAPVAKIFVYAGALDDTITVHSNITAALWAYGGGGSDTITGGAGADYIFGEDGNDKLFGGNGADKLFGGRGTDEIHGQGGDDSLYGDTDNSDDGVIDYLFGEMGRDTFYQKRSYFYSPIVADSFSDFNSSEDTVVRFDPVLLIMM